MSLEEDKNVVFSFNEQSEDEADESDKREVDDIEVKTETNDEQEPELKEEIAISKHKVDDIIEKKEEKVAINENIFELSIAKNEEVKQIAEKKEEEEVKAKSPVRFRINDMDDFKRIEIKRNTRKTRTEAAIKKTFNIEKFTEEITKITEDIELEDKEEEPKPNIFEPIEDIVPRKNEKKKTIRFHNKKTTFQYAKEMEVNKDNEGLGPDVLIETMPGHLNDIGNEKDEAI